MNGHESVMLYDVGRMLGLPGMLLLAYFALRSSLIPRQRERFVKAVGAYHSASPFDDQWRDRPKLWQKASCAGTALVESMVSIQASLLGVAVLIFGGALIVLYSSQVHWLWAAAFILLSFLHLGMRGVLKTRYRQESLMMDGEVDPCTTRDFSKWYEYEAEFEWFTAVIQICAALLVGFVALSVLV